MTLLSREFDIHSPPEVLSQSGKKGLFELNPVSLPDTSGVRTPNLGENERELEHMLEIQMVREQERKL